MLQRYFLNVPRAAAEKLIQESKATFILRRTSDEKDDEETNYIYSDLGKEEDLKAGKGVWYAISFKGIYKDSNDEICHFKLKSYETDPIKLNEKLFNICSELVKKYQGKFTLDNNVPRLRSQSELISVHRDAELRPEEQIKVSNMLSHHGALIISTQTPEKELKVGVQDGKTGMEMKKILSTAQLDASWVIITGHGNAADKVLGRYRIFGALDLEKEEKELDVKMTPAQYAQLLIRGGLKSGDHANIILNVCYGGLREVKTTETGKLTENPSFAEKLATALLDQGITSDIVASKTSVARFSGKYLETQGEIPGKRINFRVKGGPENLRIIWGRLKGENIGVFTAKNFTEAFVISSDGIGFESDIIKKLAAQRSLSSVTKKV